MRVQRAGLLVASAAFLSSCGSLPWATQAPDACEPLFAPGTLMEWVGRGDVGDMGLDPFVTNAGVADIYVGRSAPAGHGVPIAPAGALAYCAVNADGISMGPVPEGWQRP